MSLVRGLVFGNISYRLSFSLCYV